MTQPEALRLADEMDRVAEYDHQVQAAAELRRLYAELEAMTQCAKNHDASRTKYLLLNRELLEALKQAVKLNGFREFNDHIPAMKAAIAKAEGI